MIFHVKYNYRSSSTGEIFVDWFTVGDKLTYHISESQDVEVEILSIDVDDNMVAHVSCMDADKKLYMIDQTGVTTIFQKFS